MAALVKKNRVLYFSQECLLHASRIHPWKANSEIVGQEMRFLFL